MRPVVLGPNQPRQFYKGGRAIAEFREMDDTTEFGPKTGSLRQRPVSAWATTGYHGYQTAATYARRSKRARWNGWGPPMLTTSGRNPLYW